MGSLQLPTKSQQTMAKKTRTEKQNLAFYKKVFKMYKEVYGFQTSWFDGSIIEYNISEKGIDLYSTRMAFHGDTQADIICTIGALNKYYDIINGKAFCRIY